MPTFQRVALVATLVVAIVGGPGRDAGAQPSSEVASVVGEGREQVR